MRNILQRGVMKFYFLNKIEYINKHVNYKYEILTAIQVCLIGISLCMPIIQPNDFYRTVVGCGFIFSILIIGLFFSARVFKEYRMKKMYGILLSVIGYSFMLYLHIY